MDFLRDGLWEFVGVVLSLAAIIVSCWVYLAQRSRREIAFGVLSRKEIIANAAVPEDRVMILFDGISVKNVSLLTLAIKNSGNSSVRPSDFSYPVHITLGAGTKILDVKITAKKPANLETKIRFDAENLQIEPFLINPREYFIVQLLAAGSSFSVECDLRADGVSGLAQIVTTLDSLPRRAKIIAWIVAITLALSVFYSKVPYSWIKTLERLGIPFDIANILVSGPAGMIAFGVPYIFILVMMQALHRRQARYVAET